VKVGDLYCWTIQSAYNAADSGEIIKAVAIRFNENLILNRDIIIGLEGGYDPGFADNSGGITSVQSITTMAGKAIIENFVVE